jgi:invasion protein IalB
VECHRAALFGDETAAEGGHKQDRTEPPGGQKWGFLMTYRKRSVTAAEVRAIAVAALAATTLSVIGLAAGPALAQQPAPAQPPAAPKPATPPRPPAAAPRPAAPAAQPQKPATAAPAAPPAQAAAPVPAPEMPPLIYSPWAKFCVKDNNEPSGKEVCMTGKDGRLEDGRPVVGAALFESEGEPKKLRVTLPMPVILPYGARIIIDKEPPLTGVFFTCFPTGCMAEFEVTADLIGKLKKGQTLNLQAINLGNNPFTFPLPLSDSAGNSFAKANEGPPIDPKVFEAQQKKLQDELQKRADEARKKLESQGAAPAAPK